MATKKENKVERVSATLSTGTKVTASQEVIDKVGGKPAKSSK